MLFLCDESGSASQRFSTLSCCSQSGDGLAISCTSSSSSRAVLCGGFDLSVSCAKVQHSQQINSKGRCVFTHRKTLPKLPQRHCSALPPSSIERIGRNIQHHCKEQCAKDGRRSCHSAQRLALIDERPIPAKRTSKEQEPNPSRTFSTLCLDYTLLPNAPLTIAAVSFRSDLSS